MSPRILDVGRCPHCKQELERPPPRVCPACGGSLQKRFLSAGCLTTAPPPVLVASLLALAAARAGCAGEARAERAPERVVGGSASASEAPGERIALPARHP
jgi:hypothetical protein